MSLAGASLTNTLPSRVSLPNHLLPGSNQNLPVGGLKSSGWKVKVSLLTQNYSLCSDREREIAEPADSKNTLHISLYLLTSLPPSLTPSLPASRSLLILGGGLV